jgi:hypothetical protein
VIEVLPEPDGAVMIITLFPDEDIYKERKE